MADSAGGPQPGCNRDARAPYTSRVPASLSLLSYRSLGGPQESVFLQSSQGTWYTAGFTAHEALNPGVVDVRESSGFVRSLRRALCWVLDIKEQSPAVPSSNVCITGVWERVLKAAGGGFLRSYRCCLCQQQGYRQHLGGRKLFESISAPGELCDLGRVPAPLGTSVPPTVQRGLVDWWNSQAHSELGPSLRRVGSALRVAVPPEGLLCGDVGARSDGAPGASAHLLIIFTFWLK